MKKTYLCELKSALLLLILSSTALFAQVNDENFDGLDPNFRGLDYTTNGIRFQQISPTAISQMGSLSESSDFIITPTASDLGLLYNLDNSGTVNGPNVGAFDYRFGSADGTEFKLESMEADMSAKNSANGYVFLATISGYKDGVLVASDNIDFTVSDSSGSVTYTKDAIAAANGGVLTFSSDWDNIDEVRFTGGDNSSISLLMIDELDFSMPVLGIDDFQDNESITVLPNPTTNYIQINGLKEEKTYVIHNILGTKVASGNISNNEKISTRDFANGIYLLTIGSSKTLKFIKK